MIGKDLELSKFLFEKASTLLNKYDDPIEAANSVKILWREIGKRKRVIIGFGLEIIPNDDVELMSDDEILEKAAKKQSSQQETIQINSYDIHRLACKDLVNINYEL